ncbi:PAS domain S-box-containing protein [Zobellia uliginosa]|uniref:histidine kinase n=1 Tax=Zobellia uliginosa TaxID=143224 RepID=A0ABY1KQW2_9FLAO|nr:PAS domain S-box protein [Zobellia uliginosa]SIS48729.1 PAS domain S-box-containing protein [Zobellia uliginosa]
MEKSTEKAESKIPYHKIFIEQAPTTIVMLDKNMHCIAASQRWIKEYNLQGVEIVGSSYYDLFPKISKSSKEVHQKCLTEGVNTTDEASFMNKSGKVKWLHWEIFPWFISEGEVGGLFINTIDITPQKENELKKERTEDIFAQTKEVARLGTWEISLTDNKVYWSKITREIHEIQDEYTPSLEEAINFFEEKYSRPRLSAHIQDAIEKKISFDLNFELITAKGNRRWVRVIGKPEIIDGQFKSVVGLVQDISDVTFSKLELNKAHAQLRSIFNSNHNVIFSTGESGFIDHFNKGAERLLGYSAEEMIGKKTPADFLPLEEVKKFKYDVATLIGKSPANFNHYSDITYEELSDTREWNYIRKDGTSVPVQATVSNLRNDEGINIGFTVVATDISRLKKIERRLVIKNERLNYAEQLTKISNWRYKPYTGETFHSKNLLRILEIENSSTMLTFEDFLSYIHPEDRESVVTHNEESVVNKEFKNYTHRIITAKGNIKIINNIGEVVLNTEGNVVELIGTAQDVTELKMAEKKFKGLLESAPDAMVIINSSGYIQLTNKQTEHLFQFTSEELLDQPVSKIIPQEILPLSKKNISSFFNGSKVKQLGITEPLFGIRKTGQKIPVQINMAPLQTEEGTLVSLAVRDITKQKAAQRKIIKAKENLEILAKTLTDKNQQLADFTHITSHNLRAPVSNLNSLLDIYKTTDSKILRESLFDKFEMVINHLTTTLNTLVETLKIKSEHNEDDIADIKFKQVLHRTEEILAGEILKSGARITADFSECQVIRYHTIYLKSIFLNLISNAIKYRSEERTLELEIKSMTVNGKIMLQFKDNGLGIDLEKHGNKLFGLNKVFHRHPEAKGVGLFLTKSQVEAMGGTITATSQVDVGTTFTINFN